MDKTHSATHNNNGTPKDSTQNNGRLMAEPNKVAVSDPNESALDSSDSATDAADAIALKIIEILIAKFREKTGNEPTQDELDNMLNELTEERIQDMLEGKDLSDDSDSEEEENLPIEENSEEENEEVSPEEAQAEDLVDTVLLSTKRNHSPVEDNEEGEDDVNNTKRTKTETDCE